MKERYDDGGAREALNSGQKIVITLFSVTKLFIGQSSTPSNKTSRVTIDFFWWRIRQPHGN